MNDEFYIGYLPKAPALLSKWLKRAVAALFVLGTASGLWLTIGQPSFADSKFEYGVSREYSGALEEWPYPMLRTSDGSFLLVATGKHGLSAAAFTGKSVRLKGTLIQRGADRMLEVETGSLEQIGALPNGNALTFASLGSFTLRGEIVDSKCYLGVMNPGNGKVHRDCAVRCISGGAPPAFIVRDGSDDARVLLLTGANGRQLNREILSYVAEPLEISGELVRSGSTLILKAEPSRFRRYT